MTNLENLLLKKGFWTADKNKLKSIIDTLENRKKSSLSFQSAIDTLWDIEKYINKLEKENKQLKAQLKQAKIIN